MLSEETRLSRQSQDNIGLSNVDEAVVLEYDSVKKALIKFNQGNDITSRFAVRTSIEPENFETQRY